MDPNPRHGAMNNNPTIMLRRRAPKACHACRSRKVKCDVSKTGIPCSNCSRSKGDCSVTYARKRRLRREATERGIPPSSVHTFEVDLQPDAQCEPISEERSAVCDRASGSASVRSEIRPKDSPHSLRHVPEINSRPTGWSSSPCEETTGFVQLPAYIMPLSPNVDPELLQSLHRQGALSIPAPDVREELLQAYVCYVHPLLPLLDLGEFLAAIEGVEGSSPISLILYQAVMFAGLSFVDMKYLEAEGFQDRKLARNVFFGRVKYLFDADVETNPISLIQVLTLLTYWYNQLGDTKGRLHWLRIALALATDIGLNRRIDSPVWSTQQQSTRRRLWWCCFMRDKLLSASERRPSGISGDESSFPLLSMADVYDPALARALTKYFDSDGESEATILSELCIQKTKLCVLIGRILDSLYELRPRRRITSTEATMLYVPKLSDLSNADYLARDEELRQWKSDMTTSPGDLLHRHPSRVVGVNSAILEMLYYTALGLLHRPQLMHNHPKDSAIASLGDFSERTLRSAAQETTEIAEYLEEHGVLRLLPPFGVTVFLSAILQHLKDALSASVNIRNNGQRYLSQTIHLLGGLKDIYCSAGPALAFIDLVIKDKVPYEMFELGEKIDASSSANAQLHRSMIVGGLSAVSAEDKPPIDFAPGISVNGNALGDEDTEQEASSDLAQRWSGSADIDTEPPEAPPVESEAAGYAGEINDGQAVPDEVLDFQTLLNINSMSEIILSGTFDVADFDVVNWSDLFHD